MNDVSFVRTQHGEVCTQGAHVTRWSGAGGNVLFLSKESRFEPGRAIRGGVPVIFPWFGDDPDGRGRGAHGFARKTAWRVVENTETADESRVALELVDDHATRASWPRHFALRLEALFQDTLAIDLHVENRGSEPFLCELALHTYLTVGDVRRIAVHGLEDTPYLDKLDGMKRKREGSVPIVFTGEVDRTYHGTEATCRVEDPVLGRTIEIAKEGSRSTIVWNPWAEKAARLGDLGADEWRSMVCIESGNVGEDALTLAPGAAHTLRIAVAAR